MEKNQIPHDEADNEIEGPRGLFEGIGSLDAALDTVDFMRDCIAERYARHPVLADLYKTAVRLAGDMKRRLFLEAKALETVLSHLTAKLNLIKPENIKTVERAVKWVYHDQEHGLTCTGRLAIDGLCFKNQRRCRYHEADQAARRARREGAPTALPAAWEKCFGRIHPTEALFVAWTYTAVAEFEAERGCAPGDERQPVFVGFRAIADRVRATRKTLAFDKHTAVCAVRLLEDAGLIHRVVQGKPGTRRRQANGYIRVMPIPAPPADTDRTAATPSAEATKASGGKGGWRTGVKRAKAGGKVSWAPAVDALDIGGGKDRSSRSATAQAPSMPPRAGGGGGRVGIQGVPGGPAIKADGPHDLIPPNRQGEDGRGNPGGPGPDTIRVTDPNPPATKATKPPHPPCHSNITQSPDQGHIYVSEQGLAKGTVLPTPIQASPKGSDSPMPRPGTAGPDKGQPGPAGGPSWKPGQTSCFCCGTIFDGFGICPNCVLVERPRR